MTYFGTETPGYDERACKGTDIGIWFPGRDASNAAVAGARALCYGCPARRPCLEWALSSPSLEGIVGGTTETERNTIRRRRRRGAA